MISLIKAEFRKLFTIRSTYITTAVALLIIIFVNFYVLGMRGGEMLKVPTHLSDNILNTISTTTIFVSLIALLLVAHEYRYNTIMYTLTRSNSRSKVLAAKIVAITVYTVGFVLVVSVLTPLLIYLGASVKHLTLGPQTLHYADLLWRVMFVGLGNAWVGLLLAVLIRNQVGALFALFLIPTTVETLLTLLLKQWAVYLPFSALHEVVNTAPHSAEGTPFVVGHLSPIRGALVFTVYLVVGWGIGWFLFSRRDAN